MALGRAPRRGTHDRPPRRALRAESFGGGTVLISGFGRAGANRLLEVTGTMNGNGVGLGLFGVSGAGRRTSATGLLDGGTPVLTDTTSGERVTYRTR